MKVFGQFQCPKNVRKNLMKFLTLYKWKEIVYLNKCLQDGYHCRQP